MHFERTALVGFDLDDALPALKQQARASGADTITDISERRSTVGETRIYHVTGIGLRCAPQP